jgi:hypothetical protein
MLIQSVHFEGFEPTLNEIRICVMIRKMKPFESITVIADDKGRVDSYLVKTSNQVKLTDTGEQKWMRATI